MGVRIPPPLPCIDIDGQGWDDMGVLKRAQEFFREDLAEEFLRSLQNPHVVPALSVNINTWQGWRDSNPHPPDLESGALAVRATPLFSSEGTAARSEASPTADCDGKAPARTPMEPPLERGEVTPWSTVSTRRYFVSLCGVCLRHHRQYFFSSSRSGWVRLFFVVE